MLLLASIVISFQKRTIFTLIPLNNILKKQSPRRFFTAVQLQDENLDMFKTGSSPDLIPIRLCNCIANVFQGTRHQNSGKHYRCVSITTNNSIVKFWSCFQTDLELMWCVGELCHKLCEEKSGFERDKIKCVWKCIKTKQKSHFELHFKVCFSVNLLIVSFVSAEACLVVCSCQTCPRSPQWRSHLILKLNNKQQQTNSKTKLSTNWKMQKHI